MADIPDWLLALLNPQNVPAAGAAAFAPPPGLLAGFAPPSLGPLLTGRSASVDTPAVANDTDPVATPTPAVATPAPAPTQPTSNVLGTPASGAPESSPFGNVGNVLGKASDLVGSLYGGGGPGDALIALGLSNRTGGKSIEALNAIGNQRLNQAKLAAFNLQIANQQNSQNLTRNWLLGQVDKKTGEPVLKPSDVDSALARAAAGDPGQLNEYTKQFAAGDKYQFREFGGKLIGTNAYEPTDVKVVADLGNQKFMTPEEKVAANIDPNDGRNWIRGKDGTPQPVGDVSPSRALETKSDEQSLTELPKSRDMAASAVSLKQAISRGREALDSGAITGPTANLSLQARNLWGGLMGIPDAGVIETQKLKAAMASKTADLARQLSAAGHTSNADILQATIQSGGDITNDKTAIKAIMDGQEQLANDRIAQHKRSLDVMTKKYPDLQLDQRYNVPEPDYYKSPESPAQAPARAQTVQIPKLNWRRVGP